MTAGEFKRANVAPDEIIYVKILKGQDAVPIYGAAGANGMVIITTRRGTAGT